MKLFTSLLDELCIPSKSIVKPIIIDHISLHSKTVSQNGLFLAYKGTQHDGRDTIWDAINQGAAAIFYENEKAALMDIPFQTHVPLIGIKQLKDKLGMIAKAFYGPLDEQKQLFAVTGTNGKSSTTHFLAQSLNTLGMPCGLIGSLGVGVPGNLISGPNTTPDSLALFKSLSGFDADNIQHVALEASSEGLNEGRLNDIAIEVALFTNLTREHLDYHRTMQAYAKAKAILFKKPGLKAAIVNKDDAYANIMLNACSPSVSQLTYSLHNAQADIYLQKAIIHEQGVEFCIITPKGMLKGKSALLGLFNISNILGVVATLIYLNISLDKIKEALSRLQAPTGRMQCVLPKTDSKPSVLIDYAHTPDALKQALIAIRSHFPKASIYCVFGCGGDKDQGKRPMMAKVAEQFSDKVILSDDNPRFEDPVCIMNDILSGFSNMIPLVEHDRIKAIHAALDLAGKDDVVLLAGKGDEMFQIRKDKQISMNEAKIVKDYIERGTKC